VSTESSQRAFFVRCCPDIGVALLDLSRGVPAQVTMHEDAETHDHPFLYEQENTRKATITLDTEDFLPANIAVSRSPPQANLRRELKRLMRSSMKISR